MNKKGLEGFVLIEMLVSLSIAVLIGGLVTALFVYGLESCNVFTNNTTQQDKIAQTINLLRTDIEKCQEININKVGSDITYITLKFPDSTLSDKKWSFNDVKNSLEFEKGGKTYTAVEGLIVKEVKGGTTTYKSGFFDGADKLVLKITPASLNTGKYEGVNIKSPIITEYSLKYKVVHN